MVCVGIVSYAYMSHLNDKDEEKLPMASSKGTLMVRIYLHLGKTAIIFGWNLNRKNDWIMQKLFKHIQNVMSYTQIY